VHEPRPQQNPELPAESPREPERDSQDRPQVYIADLAAYNNGILHGRWIDAAQDAESLQDNISAMLAESATPGAEEWAIHDYEGFGPLRLDEFESTATVSRLARGIAKHGTAFAALAEWLGTDSANEETFLSHYRGSWTSPEAYAEDLLQDIGAWDYLEHVPEWLRPYARLDVEGFARDLQLGGDIYTADDGDQVHIFDAHI
jgi:antirestriction protein